MAQQTPIGYKSDHHGGCKCQKFALGMPSFPEVTNPPAITYDNSRHACMVSNQAYVLLDAKQRCDMGRPLHALNKASRSGPAAPWARTCMQQVIPSA